MRDAAAYFKNNVRVVLGCLIAAVAVGAILIYHLGSLTGGLSSGEQQAARAPLGWHGLYHSPWYLPLTFVRSVDFFIIKQHGQTLTRLPNAIFGFLTIATFAALIKLWHNTRIAVLATWLFATSAWVLHVSRLASFDVLYLWSLPLLLLIYIAMQKGYQRAVVAYGSVLLIGMLLYLPGLVWLVLLEIFWLRDKIAATWRYIDRPWERLAYCLSFLIWLSLLAWRLRNITALRGWLGLPPRFVAPMILLKQFAGVLVHLLARGPQYPQLWLGRAPLLDIFTLAMCLLGIYFYLTHLSAARSRLLISFTVVGIVLIGVGGAVPLSLLVPLLYLSAATGMAYLLHRWLRVFPLNPLARSFGLGLIVVAVAVSSFYNLRAYFVAWPHNPLTQSTFRYHR